MRKEIYNICVSDDEEIDDETENVDMKKIEKERAYNNIKLSLYLKGLKIRESLPSFLLLEDVSTE